MAKGQIKPKLQDPMIIKKLEEAFAFDTTIQEACFYADISPQTYYNLLESKPELLERFEALRNKPVLMARQEVVKGFKWNPDLALKYLERKRKNEFSTKQEVDNKITWALEITDVSSKLDELLD